MMMASTGKAQTLPLPGMENIATLEEAGGGGIPSDWQTVLLKDVATSLYGGGTPSTKHPEYWNGEIPWTTSAYLGDAINFTKAPKCISHQGLTNSSSRLVPRDNLLIGTRVGIGKVAVNRIEVAISQDLTALVVDKSFADETFLAYALRSSRVQVIFQQAARGTTIKGVSRTEITQIPISLPPLPEQRAIAHVLGTVQRAIEASDRVLAATRELKRSLMRHLFTYGPVPLDQAERVALKETEVGWVPERWETTALGDVATLQRGNDLPTAQRKEGPYPVVGSNGIVGHHSEFIAHGPGVLVGRSGSVGAVSWVGEDYWPLNTSLWVRDFHGNDALFVYYFLSHIDLSQYSAGVSVPTLNRNLVHPVKVGKPPIPIQRQISSSLSTVDRGFSVEQDRKQALEALFQSLLHHLMTGKVRVKAA